MIGRPIHMNRIRRFDGYDAFPDQLNDNVLRAQDRQCVLTERCFLQGSSTMSNLNLFVRSVSPQDFRNRDGRNIKVQLRRGCDEIDKIGRSWR